MLDPASDMEPVPQADTLMETVAVPHGLVYADGDDTVEPEGLSVPLMQVVPDALMDTDEVGEIVDMRETVGEVESVPNTD